MDCSSGSGFLNSVPIMPVDMAVRLYLACSPPLHPFLRNHGDCCAPSVPPLRPCLTTAGDDVTMATVVSACRNGGKPGRQKKSVVFADSQGLALATVHVLEELEDDELSELQFQLTQIEGATSRLQLEDSAGSVDSGPALVLDFTPPAADYLDLRNRLKAQQVSLETCSVQDRLLSGTVQVRNICFEKSVWIRITFDSWRSFRDVRCWHLNNVYASPDVDTFSFSIEVPAACESGGHVQFCVQYCTQDKTFWDNNHGNNYCLAPVDQGAGHSDDCPAALPILVPEKRSEVDPFGSPRTSAGIFPEWQSYGHIQTSTPYW
ncbi:protein phosphatase 1 regulatory subunit 3C-B-like [Salarias fasciatus]|nr:protein phosphatase 1 regulatory subunit 3C-B-like [Salarias fasciatus]